MALQSSGAISLANIQTEFGGSNPISLSEYYGASAGIPSSGAISLSNFYGASSSIVITITEGVVGASANPGYDGYYYMYGSADTTAVGSNTLGSVYNSKGGPGTFTVILLGHVPQNSFSSVLPQGGSALSSSSASLFEQSITGTSVKYTMWSWSNVKISRWDGSGTSTVTFVL